MKQTRTANGTIMPLLMGCTQPSKIEMLKNEQPVIYDPMTQTVVYDMRQVGTYSLKISQTSLGHGKGYTPDRKNQIDDQKHVN